MTADEERLIYIRRLIEEDRYFFSDHCRKEMEKRGISEVQVLAIATQGALEEGHTDGSISVRGSVMRTATRADVLRVAMGTKMYRPPQRRRSEHGVMITAIWLNDQGWGGFGRRFL